MENQVFPLCLITVGYHELGKPGISALFNNAVGYHEHEKLGISALFHASLTAITLAGDPSPVHAEADVCSDFG